MTLQQLFKLVSSRESHSQFKDRSQTGPSTVFERLEPRVLLSAPQAVDDAAVTDLNTLAVIDVLANDTDPDPGDTLSLLAGSLSDPEFGSASIVGGAIHYTPDTDYRGSDSLLYTVKDSSGNTDVGKLVLNVAREQGISEAITGFTFNGDGSISTDFGSLQLSIGQHQTHSFKYELPDGSVVSPNWHQMFYPNSRSVDLENRTATAYYSWGEATVEWLVHEDKLNARVSITNDHATNAMINGRYTVGNSTAGPANLDNLTNQWNHATPSVARGPAMHLLEYVDGSGAMLVGIEGGQPGEAAKLRGTATGNQNPQVLFPRIEPGETWTGEITLRIGDPTQVQKSDAPEIAPDVFRDVGRFHEFVNHWEDRRGIGAVFAASSQYAPFNNPGTDNLRGWAENQLGGPVDVTTPAGIDAFHDELLDQLENSIANAKEFDWQGLILWDLEGQEGPHPISTYVGAPETLEHLTVFGTTTQVDGTAPEMVAEYDDTGVPFVDYYMQKVEEANLRIGLTLRPTAVHQNPDWQGDHGSAPWRIMHYTTPDPYQVLHDRIEYAVNRWGVSIFMLDSFTMEAFGDGEKYQANNATPLPAQILKDLQQDFPDILLLPENDIGSHLAYSAPWQAQSAQGGGVHHSESWRRAMWPDDWAFSVNGRQTELLPDSEMVPGGNQDGVTRSIQRGDVQIANAWYTWDDTDNLDTLYDLHGDPQLDLTDLSTITVDVNGTNPTGTINFGRDDRSTPRNDTVDWAIASLPGRISNPSSTSGELVLATDTESLTFDIDASGLAPGVHEIGKVVLDTQGHETWVNVRVNVVTPVGYLSTFSRNIPNASFENTGSGGAADAANWNQTNAPRVVSDASDGNASLLLDSTGSTPDARQVVDHSWYFHWNATQYDGAENAPPGTAFGVSYDAKNLDSSQARIFMSPSFQGWGSQFFGYNVDWITHSDWQTHQVAGQRTLAQWGSLNPTKLTFRTFGRTNDPGQVLVDNISQLNFARPELAISDTSAIDLGAVAASTSADSAARTITNSQAVTYTDDQTGAVASTLYGLANLTVGNGDTDHVGAVITGGDASLFEFVTANPGANGQELKLVGSDGQSGLDGGPSPETESLQVRFLGSATAGTYTTTVRVVTQAANAGSLSTGAAGEPLDGLLYTDMPVTVTVGGAMQASSTAVATDSPNTITARDAERMLTLAGAYWQKQGYQGAMRLAHQVSIEVRDLPDSTLGLSSQGQILLDTNAAGLGWYVDAQPTTSQEYLSAQPPQGMDLFSVLVHELGHLLGESHDQGPELSPMDQTLAPGQRLTWF